jgi:hypothetical protein
MYPAIETTLRLNGVCAAQPSRHAALGYAFRSLHLGHQPAPRDRTGSNGVQVQNQAGQDVDVWSNVPRPGLAPAQHSEK